MGVPKTGRLRSGHRATPPRGGGELSASIARAMKGGAPVAGCGIAPHISTAALQPRAVTCLFMWSDPESLPARARDGECARSRTGAHAAAMVSKRRAARHDAKKKEVEPCVSCTVWG